MMEQKKDGDEFRKAVSRLISEMRPDPVDLVSALLAMSTAATASIIEDDTHLEKILAVFELGLRKAYVFAKIARGNK
jgi:hypothetical protein